MLLVETGGLHSQNLVPNSSFESYNTCPNDDGQIDLAAPWIQGNLGSADYFHSCASPGDEGVPANWFGFQWPYSGSAYAGVWTKNNGNNYREYITAPLTTALVSGEAYLVSFYISVPESRCAIRSLGVLFTPEIPENDGIYVLPYNPQIELNGELLGSYSEWTRISRCFIAEGDESYITIGNFRTDLDSPADPDCSADFAPTSYYYIDSVTVEAMPFSDELFILPPAEVCGAYIVDPGSAENYFWSDSTTNPTLTVTESGTYYVTLSNECAFSYGEIDVTIIPDAPPVALPNDTLLCAGETLEIFLDPDAGTYQWNDNNTSNEYTITDEGMYIVTLTDNCDETSDTINVFFLDAPPGFSMGEDTLICDGDAFTISFDPALGEFEWQDQSSGSSYTIDDDGTYALTISNQCGEVSDEIQIDFVDPISFSIGPEQITLCEGEEFQVELDAELGTFLWHDNSTENVFTITESEVVSVTVSNACYSETDEMLVDYLYQPQFSLGPDITVCSGQFPFDLDLSNVEYAQAWEWTGGSTQSVFQVTTTGTYGVTISNDCFAVSDEIVVNTGDVDPVVTLPLDQQLCPGQSIVLDAGGLTGNYQWQDMSTADTLLVTQAGTYALTVTNICGSGSDTVNISFVPVLTEPNLGPDFSLCPGETGVLFANIDNVSYQWSEINSGPIGTSDSIIIISAGTYVLQITDACGSAFDTIVITTNANPPDVDLPSALHLCQGDTIIIDAGITGVSYLWQDASVSSQYVTNQPGLYSITVTNSCGSDTDSVFVTEGGPAPIVDLGNDLAICPGDQVTITPLALNVDSWLWHDGTTDTSLTVSSAGEVTVAVTNDCGVARDTLVVTLLPDIPVFDLGADVGICPGDSVTFSIAVNDVEILWHDNTTEYELTTSEAGIVFATIENSCGSFSDSAEVIVLPDIPHLDLGDNQSLCPGETITVDPGIPDVDYLWHDGSDATFYVTTQPGDVILTISNACGSSTDTLEIILDTNGPQVDLGEDILACEGVVVLIESGISGVEYLWNDNSTEPNLEVTASGTYFLQVSNACGIDADTIVVEINGTVPMVSLGPDTVLCDDEILILTAHAENSITWHDGSDGTTFTVTSPGTYALIETNHCGSAGDTIEVSYQNAPLPFELGDDVELCAGDSLVLIAPVTTDMITWQDGSHGQTLVANTEQLYSLTITNTCGSQSDEIEVTIDEQVPVVDLGPDQQLCAGQSLSLHVGQDFPASYLWSTGSMLPSIEISFADVYAVTVTTDCYAASDEIVIETGEDCNTGIYIPNVFSPNDDGMNDTWSVLIENASVTAIECRIFDRWGDLMYETTQMPVIWDGRFRDKVVMPGVYVYVLHLIRRNAEARILAGDITVVR